MSYQSLCHAIKKAMLIVVIFFITACNQKTTDELLAEAQELMQQQNHKQAVVVLKNVVRQKTTDGHARFLLAQSYLFIADYESAEKELKRAIELEYDINEIIPLLIRVRWLLANPMSLNDISQYTLSHESLLKARTLIAIYNVTLGELVESLSIMQQNITQSQSVGFYSNVSKAWVAGIDGQSAAAIELLSELIERDSPYMDALLVRAMLYTLEKNYTAAIDDYQKYLNHFGLSYFVQLNYIAVLIASGDLNQADEYVDKLLAIAPKDPFINEYKAELKFRAKDYKGAIEYIAITLSQAQQSYKANYISGVSNFQLANWELAYNNLNKVEQYLPPQSAAKSMLVNLKIKLGYVNENIEALNLGTDFDVDDFNTLASASWSLLEQDNIDMANLLLNEMNNISLSNSEDLIKRGMIKNAVVPASGLDDLERAMQLAPEKDQARLLLIYEKIKVGKVKEALADIDGWLEGAPNNINAMLAKGIAYISEEKYQLATPIFNQVLIQQPNHLGAIHQLAFVSLKQQDYAKAEDYLAKILSLNPNHNSALSLLVIFGIYNTEQEKVLSFTDNLIKSNPNNTRMAIAIAQIYEALNLRDAAIQLLDSVKEYAQDSAGYFYLKGLLNFRNRHYLEAKSDFENLLRLKPNSLDAHKNLILSYEKLGHLNLAIEQLDTAIKLNPKSDFLKIMKGRILVTTRKPEDIQQAKNIIEQLEAQQHQSGYFSELIYLYYRITGEDQKAITQGQQLYQDNPNNETIILYVQALHQAGKTGEALEILAKEIPEENMDPRLQQVRAQFYLSTKPEKAISYYLKQVNKNPENFQALNNLSWAYTQTGNTEQAILHGLKAIKLVPNNPSILDTLALAYMEAKDYVSAEKHIQKAHEMAPNHAPFSIRYAQVLIELDKLEQSRAVLAKLKNSPEKQKLQTLINSKT
ncbi:XrtA/PEP-CTERM system TPR-repeat protein PrsT [Thalassotalea aquiviva]|uniref:XrtA/PEP-CTERM system TPR-repeat protein PrsT n=1 Tax=Thalassotalea aquiviva TaxID=3242415 RepID=UPI00352AB460